MSRVEGTPWYCAKTTYKMEDRAAIELVRQRIPAFDPTFRIRTPDRHYAIKRLFPGYIFFQLHRPEDWPIVERSTGIAGVLTAAQSTTDRSPYKQPSAIAGPTIESLRLLALGKDEFPSTQPARSTIHPGTYVRVISGPLADQEGLDLSHALVLWTDRQKAALLLHMFNRQIEVAFFLRDLEPV